MTRALILFFSALVLLAVSWLAVVLAPEHALDDYQQIQSTNQSTSTTWWDEHAVPSLPDNFDPTKLEPRAKRKPRVYGGVNPGGHPCGPAFDLPPCFVMMRESGGNIHAYNPTGCSGHGCFGKWQCDPTTCDGTGTEEQQDAEARRVWNHGCGARHWGLRPSEYGCP